MSCRFTKSLTVAVPCLSAIAGCAGTANQVDNLRDVDVLVSQVELVHFESELSRARAGVALQRLHDIVAGRFEIDAVGTYAEFIAAVETSEEQAEQLRATVEPMHTTADQVFAGWRLDLEAFATAGLRRRSEVRLDATLERYQAVIVAVAEAQKAYDIFNLGVRDHAIYLGHDFNAASVSDIEDEVIKLTDWAAELDGRLGACMEAAEEYVRAASLPGTLTVSRAGS